MRPTLRRVLSLLAVWTWALLAPGLVLAQEIPVSSETITTGGADCTTATSCSSFSTDGVASFGIKLDIGTGTFNFEVLVDADAAADDAAWVEAPNGATSATADGYYSFVNSGFRRFRVRAEAGLSGPATLKVSRGYLAPVSVSLGDVDIDLSDGATAAKQDVIIAHVDTLEALLGTTNAGLTTLDGRVDGLEALIGTTNSSLATIDGRVDGLEALIGITNTNTAATTTALTTTFGTAPLFLATQADNQALTDDALRTASALYMYDGTNLDLVRGNTTDGLLVNLGANNDVTVTGTVTVGSHAVTNAGTFAVQSVEGAGALLTSAQLMDNAVGTVAAGTAATGSLLAGLVYNSSPITLTNLQGAALQGDANGYLKVNVAAGSAGGPTDTADASVATGQSAGLNISLLYGLNNAGTAWVPAIAQSDQEFDAAVINYGPLMMCAGSTTTLAAISGNDEGARVGCDLNGNQKMVGAVAHDGVDAGNPIGVGYRAIAHGTNPTAVAAADRTVGYANRAGIPFSGIAHPNILTREWTVLDSDGAQTGTALVDISAGTKIVVLSSKVSCDADNTADVDFRMAFDTDGTFASAATTGTSGIIDSQPGIIAGGGGTMTVPAVGGDGEDVRYSLEDPAGGACRGVIKYYTIES